jgi:hypothetical protein
MQIPPHKKATPNPIERATESGAAVRPVSRFSRYAIPVGLTLGLALTASGIGVLVMNKDDEGAHCDRDRSGALPFEWVKGFDPRAWIKPAARPDIAGAEVAVSPPTTAGTGPTTTTEPVSTTNTAPVSVPTIAKPAARALKPIAAPRIAGSSSPVSQATPQPAPSAQPLLPVRSPQKLGGEAPAVGSAQTP